MSSHTYVCTYILYWTMYMVLPTDSHVCHKLLHRRCHANVSKYGPQQPCQTQNARRETHWQKRGVKIRTKFGKNWFIGLILHQRWFMGSSDKQNGSDYWNKLVGITETHGLCSSSFEQTTVVHIVVDGLDLRKEDTEGKDTGFGRRTTIAKTHFILLANCKIIQPSTHIFCDLILYLSSEIFI